MHACMFSSQQQETHQFSNTVLSIINYGFQLTGLQIRTFTFSTVKHTHHPSNVYTTASPSALALKLARTTSTSYPVTATYGNQQVSLLDVENSLLYDVRHTRCSVSASAEVKWYTLLTRLVSKLHNSSQVQVGLSSNLQVTQPGQ